MIKVQVKLLGDGLEQAQSVLPSPSKGSIEGFHKLQIQYSADPPHSAEARPHFLRT